MKTINSEFILINLNNFCTNVLFHRLPYITSMVEGGLVAM